MPWWKPISPLITYLLNQATARFWGTKASETQALLSQSSGSQSTEPSLTVPGMPSTESTETSSLLRSQLTHNLPYKPGFCPRCCSHWAPHTRRRPAPHQALRFSEAGCVPAGNLPAGLYFYWPKTHILFRILQSLVWQLVFKISNNSLSFRLAIFYNMQKCFYF